MSLDDDIRQAIEANLTAEIGTRLKERLEQADTDAKDLVKVRAVNKDIGEVLVQHEEQAHLYRDLDEREKLTNDRERGLDLREAVMDVQEKYATAARDDMMKVIEHVFKGPGSRLAFDLNGNLSGLINASGMSQSPSAYLSGKIETESDDG